MISEGSAMIADCLARARRGLACLACASALAIAAPAAAGDPPSRVAIADGVVTEIVWLLGAGDRVVGVDATSSYPPEAKEKPQLGYFRDLSAEGILSLAPDLLIASPHAGPKVVLDQVAAAGVPVATAPDVETLADIPAKVIFVGEALGLQDKAAALADQLQGEIEKLDAGWPDLADPPRVIFVLAMRDGSPLVAGTGTAPDAVIASAGGANAATFEGYKPMSAESVIAAAPDLLLMTSEQAATLGGADSVLERPGFALTPAGKAGRTVTLPALTVLGLGPRSPEAVQLLREALSP
jgi:iron complex transport system substrate-binding protein